MSIKESALSVISSIAQSDFVRAVTSDGNSRRVTVANLAKAIVESYTGSSLGGSQRSVKAAIDSLNSKMLASLGTAIPTNADLNNYVTPGRYYAGNISGIANLPTTSNITSLDMIVFPRASASRVWQLCFVYYSTPKVYIRAQSSASEFTAWIQLA